MIEIHPILYKIKNNWVYGKNSDEELGHMDSSPKSGQDINSGLQYPQLFNAKSDKSCLMAFQTLKFIDYMTWKI